MVKLLSFYFALFMTISAQAEFINIGIFASKKVNSFEFTVRAGKYALFNGNGKIKDLPAKAKLTIIYKVSFNVFGI